MSKNPNWGGKRPGAGRPRLQMFKPVVGERLTPVSDLFICTAENEVDEGDTRRGVVIGDIWYGADESLAIAEFVQHHHQWLKESEKRNATSQD